MNGGRAIVGLRVFTTSRIDGWRGKEVGSSPVHFIKVDPGTDLVEVGPVAQGIRARGYEPRCRGFESLLARNQSSLNEISLYLGILYFASGGVGVEFREYAEAEYSSISIRDRGIAFHSSTARSKLIDILKIGVEKPSIWLG
jgi:hypothetical protein